MNLRTKKKRWALTWLTQSSQKLLKKNFEKPLNFLLCFLHISSFSVLIFKLDSDKNDDKLLSIEYILNTFSINIFLLLKQKQVNLTFFLSLLNLIKGNSIYHKNNAYHYNYNYLLFLHLYWIIYLFFLLLISLKYLILNHKI